MSGRVLSRKGKLLINERVGCRPSIWPTLADTLGCSSAIPCRVAQAVDHYSALVMPFRPFRILCFTLRAFHFATSCP